MTQELEFVYEMEVETSDFNERGVLKPYVYQNLFAKVAEKHLMKHNVHVEATMEYNMAWALVSISYEILKPVKETGKIYANTWYSKRKGPYFRREILFRNSEGEILFQGSTFSVILDLEKRTVYRKKEVPFLHFEPTEEFTIEARPTMKTHLDYEKVEERVVKNSHIDLLGHVNNSRYGEFAYDVFSEEERMDLVNFNRMEFYFQSELRRGDRFSIHRAKEERQLMIRGYNETKGCVSFEIVFEKENKEQ